MFKVESLKRFATLSTFNFLLWTFRLHHAAHTAAHWRV